MTARPAELKGLTVLNPRPVAQAASLTAALQAAGASVLELPLLAIEPLALTPEARHHVMNLDRYQGVIHVSANAAQLALQHFQDFWPQWPLAVDHVAVGRATARLLSEAGLSPLVPSREDSEGVLDLPRLHAVAGERWLLCRGDQGRELMADTLRQRGADVDVLPLYRRVLPALAGSAWQHLDSRPDVVVLTSALVWRHWQIVAGAEATRPVLVSISQRLAEQLHAAGAGEVVQADGADPSSVVHALCCWHASRHHDMQLNPPSR